MKKLGLATMVVGLLATVVVGNSRAAKVDLSDSIPVITGPSKMSLYNIGAGSFSYWVDFQWNPPHNEFRVTDYGRLEHTEEVIENGIWTIGVDDPDNAFDELIYTRAIIPWYWGEGGHYDFLHFTSYIGDDAVFIFHILVEGSADMVGSAAIDGYDFGAQQWEQITSYPLDRGKCMTIIVHNAQNYVENGYINLRVKWIDGWSWQDFCVHGIWR